MRTFFKNRILIQYFYVLEYVENPIKYTVRNTLQYNMILCVVYNYFYNYLLSQHFLIKKDFIPPNF